MEECMEFAMAAGFMSPEEIENTKKTLEAIKKGAIPPNCQGKEECDVYCSQEEHFEECLNFAEAAGFISAEDAEKAREGGQGGPGGCKTQEECEAFCSKPENAETCIDFGVKMGDISPEEAERMRQGMQPPEGTQLPEGGGAVPPGEQQMPGVFPEGAQPPEGTIFPLPEQIQQIQELSPTESPQSILWTVKKFLANIALFFLK